MKNGQVSTRKEAIRLAHRIERVRKENAEVMSHCASKATYDRVRAQRRNVMKRLNQDFSVKSCVTSGRTRKHCERGGHDKTSMGTVTSVKHFAGTHATCVYKHHKNL